MSEVGWCVRTMPLPAGFNVMGVDADARVKNSGFGALARGLAKVPGQGNEPRQRGT